MANCDRFLRSAETDDDDSSMSSATSQTPGRRAYRVQSATVTSRDKLRHGATVRRRLPERAMRDNGWSPPTCQAVCHSSAVHLAAVLPRCSCWMTSLRHVGDDVDYSHPPTMLPTDPVDFGSVVVREDAPCAERRTICASRCNPLR